MCVILCVWQGNGGTFGPFYGKPSIEVDEVRRLREEEGLGATEIARHLGIVRSSVYRVLSQ